MELNEFVASFAEQFEDTDPSKITANTRFHDLDEWSSLIAMSVMALVKTQYGKIITGTEIRECATVEALFNLIKSKK